MRGLSFPQDLGNIRDLHEAYWFTWVCKDTAKGKEEDRQLEFSSKLLSPEQSHL